MPFDGVAWAEPSLVSPYAYAPGSPLTADALARSLVNGYCAARSNSRRILEQVFELNQRNVTGGLDRFETNVIMLEAASGYVWIDDTVTHLVGLAIIEVVTAIDTTAYQRVTLDDGTTVHQGPTSERHIAANGSLLGAGPNGRMVPNEDVAASASGGLFAVACELDLETAGAVLGQRVYVSLDAYALTGSAQVAHRVRAASIFAEVR